MTLEKEIVDTMNKAMEDHIITSEESEIINGQLDELRSLILEDDIITLDKMKVVGRIHAEARKIFKQCPIIRNPKLEFLIPFII